MTCEWERLTDVKCEAEAVASSMIRGDLYSLCSEHIEEAKRDMRERETRL